MSQFETEVPGVFADDAQQYGIETFPVFDVPSHVFNQNISFEEQQYRSKLVPEPDSNLEKYLRNSVVARPFYLRTQTDDGPQTKMIK